LLRMKADEQLRKSRDREARVKYNSEDFENSLRRSRERVQ